MSFNKISDTIIHAVFDGKSYFLAGTVEFVAKFTDADLPALKESLDGVTPHDPNALFITPYEVVLSEVGAAVTNDLSKRSPYVLSPSQECVSKRVCTKGTPEVFKNQRTSTPLQCSRRLLFTNDGGSAESLYGNETLLNPNPRSELLNYEKECEKAPRKPSGKEQKRNCNFDEEISNFGEYLDCDLSNITIDDGNEELYELELVGLPPKPNMELLKFLISKTLGSVESNKYGTEIKNLKELLDHVVVAFSSKESYEKMLSVHTFKYRGEVVHVRQPQRHHCKVIFGNLPLGFDTDSDLQEFFKCIVRGIIDEAGLGHGEQDPIVAFELIGPNAVTMQFTNFQSSKHLELLEHVEFCGEQVSVIPYSSSPQSIKLNPARSTIQQVLWEENKDTALPQENFHSMESKHTEAYASLSFDNSKDNQNILNLKYSPYVKLSNVPVPLQKDRLVDFMNDQMRKANIAFDNEKPVKLCVAVSKSHKTAVLEFDGYEEANLSCLMENVVFGGNLLQIRKCLFSSETSDLGEDEEQDKPYERNVSLDCDEGKEILLKLLIKCRHDFPKSGSIDGTLDKIRKLLARKGVVATLQDIKKARKGFRDQYRHNKNNDQVHHKYFVAQKVAFDGGNISLLSGTEFDVDACLVDSSSDVESEAVKDLVKFSASASWTTNAAKALVAACIDNKDVYDDATRRPKFWRQVSLLLAQASFFYYPNQCQNKMESLIAAYKDMCQNAERTGAQGPLLAIQDEATRQLMVLVSEFMQGNVTVKPKVTITAGLMQSVKYDKTTEDMAAPRVRNRPPILKRRLTDRERLTAAEVAKASAMSLLAKTYAKKYGVSTDDSE